MKKNLIVISIAVLLLVVGLCGCNEISNDSSNNNLVELSNFGVTTEWGNSWERTVKDGFYHEFPDDITIYYYVRGNVRNIGEKPIDSVSITAKFLDAEDNYLDESSTLAFDLYLNESKSFEIKAHNAGWMSTNPDYCKYFEHVDSYQITAEVNLHE
jgi:hypothetical protein